VWCVWQIVVEAKDGYDVNLFRRYMENYVFGFVDVDGHPVATKPIRQLCEFRANPSQEILPNKQGHAGPNDIRCSLGMDRNERVKINLKHTWTTQKIFSGLFPFPAWPRGASWRPVTLQISSSDNSLET
jgi:hypothetical protein